MRRDAPPQGMVPFSAIKMVKKAQFSFCMVALRVSVTSVFAPLLGPKNTATSRYPEAARGLHFTVWPEDALLALTVTVPPVRFASYTPLSL